jgi:hypothetical protein
MKSSTTLWLVCAKIGGSAPDQFDPGKEVGTRAQTFLWLRLYKICYSTSSNVLLPVESHNLKIVRLKYAT